MLDLELESMSQAAISSCRPHARLLLAISRVLANPVAANPYLYHFAAACTRFEQARSVSSYVSSFGSSSMSETRTTTGWSFLGMGNKKTTVCSRK